MVQQGLPDKISVVIEVPESLQLAPTAEDRQMLPFQNGALFRSQLNEQQRIGR